MKLKEYINKTYYQGYSYSYPHKMAYRPFEKPFSLEVVPEFSAFILTS